MFKRLILIASCAVVLPASSASADDGLGGILQGDMPFVEVGGSITEMVAGITGSFGALPGVAAATKVLCDTARYEYDLANVSPAGVCARTPVVVVPPTYTAPVPVPVVTGGVAVVPDPEATPA